MDNRPLLFLDSGTGGPPHSNPGEPLVYAPDRENFPYRAKSREELIAALLSLTGKFPAGEWPQWAESFGLTLYGSSCGGV
jgi:glutamate racemase